MKLQLMKIVCVLGITTLIVPVVEAQESGSPEVYSLERAMGVALANSRTIAEAEQQLAQAGGQVREAWASVFPDVTTSASYARNLRVQQGFLPALIFDPTASPDEVIPVRFGSDNSWTARVDISQPLFQYDAFIGVGAAGRFRALQEERVRGTSQNVVTAVRRAYLAALLASEDVRLTRKSIQRVRKTLEETRAMNRAGLASDYDVLRLEVQLGNLEPNLRRAQNTLAARKRDLMVEMGMDPVKGDDIVLEGTLNELDIANAANNNTANAALLSTAGFPLNVRLEFDGLYRAALNSRTDVRQQLLTINLEEARLKVQKSDYFPKISVFANYAVTAQENGSPSFFGENSNQRTTTAATGISISLPIFKGLSRNARVQQSKAIIHQNEAALGRLQQEVANEIQTFLDNVDEARQRALSQRRAVEQAERGFEIASSEYRAGVGSQLQITDAELALRQSEFNYAQAVYDYLVARAQLDAAVGTVPDTAGNLAVRNGL